MPGKIISSETVALIQYQDRWATIVDNTGKPLLEGDTIYADHLKRNDHIGDHLRNLYLMSLEKSPEEAFDTLTRVKYFVLCFLVHPFPEEVIGWYDPARYQLDEQRLRLLRALFRVLHAIRHVLRFDRNQVIDQVLSFCPFDSCDPLAVFCQAMKDTFNQQLLEPQPSAGFLRRLLVKRILTKHRTPVKGIGFFHNNELLVSIDDHQLFLWRLATEEKLNFVDLTEEKLEVTSLEVVEDQRMILATFREGVAICWKWEFRGEQLDIAELGRIREERAFLKIRSYSGGLAAIAWTQGALLLWDVVNDTVEKIATSIESLHSLDVFPNGDIVVCGGSHFGDDSDKVFKVLQAGTWKELYVSPPHEWPVDDVHVVGDGRVACRANYVVVIYDIFSGVLVFQKDYKQTLHYSCYIPERDLLMIVKTNTIYTLNTRTWEEGGLITTHHGIIKDIVVVDSGNLIITASDDQTIRIWDGAMLLANMMNRELHSGSISAIINMDDCLVSAGRDGRLIVWDGQTLKPVKAIDAHNHWISGMQQIVGTSEFLSYGWDGCVHFRDWKTFERTASFSFDGKKIVHLYYHAPLGKMVFFEYDGPGWVYDVAGRRLDRLPVEEKLIRSFYMGENESWIVTGTGRILSFSWTTNFLTPLGGGLTAACAGAFYEGSVLWVVDREKNVFHWDGVKREYRLFMQPAAIITGLIQLDSRHILTINGEPHYVADNTVRVHDLMGRTLSQFTLETPLTAGGYNEKNGVVCLGDSAGQVYFFRVNVGRV